jgi:hypothetical protein
MTTANNTEFIHKKGQHGLPPSVWSNFLDTLSFNSYSKQGIYEKIKKIIKSYVCC